MRFFAALLVISLAAMSSADIGFGWKSLNTYKRYDFGVQYAAVAYLLDVPGKDYVINSVVTTNMQGKSNDDVQALHIVHQNVRYLPHRYLDYFKSINHLHIIDSGLETLEGETLDGRIRYVHFNDNRLRTIPRTFFTNTVDMELISVERNLIETLDAGLFENMPKLRFVSFAGNRIRMLPGTLFVRNPMLECISFENNGLVKIGSELVKDLTKLKGVSFDGNVCINIAYWNEPEMRTEIGRELATNCGGVCDNMIQHQKQIELFHDAVEMMEERKPMCSYMKNHFIQKVKLEKDSDSTDSDESDSSELEQQHKQKYGPNHACPHAHYPVMKN